MIKHDCSEEEMVWNRLKLPKLVFVSHLPKVKPSSHHDVGYEPRQLRDMGFHV